MISAEKARDIANRSRFNLYDQQLRNLYKQIENAAKEGAYSFSITTKNYGDLGFDYDFFFGGAKRNDDYWQKITKALKDNGYTVSFAINGFDSETISVFW